MNDYLNKRCIDYYDNKNYLKLELDGEYICKELPHYGKYNDGRYYSRFHSINKEQRKRILWDGIRLKEIYDISHCYPTLLVKLIQGKVEQIEVRRWKELVFDFNRDVYIQMLRYSNIQITKENRNRIKPYVQKFINGLPRSINSNLYNKGIRNNDPKYARAVYKYMKDNFNNIFNFIYYYDTIIQEYFDIKEFKIKQKRVKRICHDLQVIEREVIEQMTKELDKINIEYITLFDGIYIKDQDKEININFNKILLNYFNYRTRIKKINLDQMTDIDFNKYIDKNYKYEDQKQPQINPRI